MNKIQLCSDDVLKNTVRIMDIYYYLRFWAEIEYGTIDDYGWGHRYGDVKNNFR
jgi:hypothetical protein